MVTVNRMDGRVDPNATDMTTSEATTALSMIIDNVIRQHEGLQHRYNNLIHQSSEIPTAAQAREIENLIQKELADCAGKDPTTIGRTWPMVTVNRMDGRVDPSANGDGPGTQSPPAGMPIPQTALSRPNGQQNLPKDGQRPGPPNQPWQPRRF